MVINRINRLLPAIGLCIITLASGCSNRSLSIPNETTADSSNKSSYSSSTFGFYDLSSFDVYTDDTTVHLLLAGKSSAKDKHIKLRYSRSDDGGLTWKETVDLSTLPVAIASRGNDVQIAAKDNQVLAVWQTSGELPGMGPMTSAYSSDNGQTWTLGKNPAANNAGDQSHLDIAADDKGRFHVVWLEDPEENGYQSLRYTTSEDHGINWSNARTLDDSTCSCCWNTLVLSPENDLNILYRDMNPRDMALLQSTDKGKTWNQASTVGDFGWQFDGCPHVGGSLAYGGKDRPEELFSLVWTGLDTKAGLYFLASNDRGKSWTSPLKVGNTAIHADIAVHGGKIAALWDEMEPEGSSLFYAHSEIDGRSLSSAKRLTKAANAATHPRLAVTERGLLAIWTEKPSKQPGRLAWQIQD
ncbi:MAG: exo-alpha-sialidase [Methylococcaceae bacterium]|nr:exo-alpha-sialidase [Methylococcaceae bacterium]